MRRAGCRFLLVVSLFLLGGCGDSGGPWALRDVSGLLRPLAFTLHDGSGQERTAEDFAGEVVLLYFGYTHCPDVCPATLARLAGVLRELGPSAAQRVRILFVSVDPARDTPALLQAYAQAFGPRVVGLSGTPAQLRELSKRYRVTYGLGDADASGDYEVSHSSGVFIFDSHGAARLLATENDSADRLASDLHRLLSTVADRAQ